MRTTLEVQAASLGCSGRMTFHGFVEQKSLPSRLRACHCLVLPSLYECGGAVVLEAMALGLPVIATNWGGPADYLDGTTGILVNPTDPAAFCDGLREAMQRLAEDRQASREIGAAGARKARSQYAWTNKVVALKQVLAALDSPQSRSR
jgi:glycosyltransferase involved in cell wall biosynthesis